jgi:hypothetical protein
MEAVQFAALASEIFPNPVAGAFLAVEIGTALTAAASLVEEAEEEDNQSSSSTSKSSSTSTSSSSSETPTATQYVVALDSKWPSLIVDAFVEAFPENGTRENFNGLGLDTFVTDLSDELAQIVSTLPIFTYVVPNAIGPVRQGRYLQGPTSLPLAWLLRG